MKGLSIMSGKHEYGDYQTPIDFAKKVCLYLKDYRHIEPSAIIEPTCGLGSFLQSSLHVSNKNMTLPTKKEL